MITRFSGAFCQQRAYGRPPSVQKPSASSRCTTFVHCQQSHQVASVQPEEQQHPALQAAGSSSTSSSSSSQASSSEDVWDYNAPSHVVERNQTFVDEQLAGRVILAPLTKGGNLPFRSAHHVHMACLTCSSRCTHHTASFSP